MLSFNAPRGAISAKGKFFNSPPFPQKNGTRIKFQNYIRLCANGRTETDNKRNSRSPETHSPGTQCSYLGEWDSNQAVLDSPPYSSPRFCRCASVAYSKWVKIDDCRYVANEWNDGDSFHVATPHGERIFQLYFVDTPESEDSFPERVVEQAAYFGITSDQSIDMGKKAAEFTKSFMNSTFTVWTKWHDARGRSKLERFYALVRVGDKDLSELA